MVRQFWERFRHRSGEGLEKELLAQLDRTRLPKHIAIIMDGNGRWAQRRGLPRSAGHRAGVESLREILKICLDLNIHVLTVYAFSTENWKRPAKEVNILMDLLTEYIQKELDELDRNGVQIRVIGCLEELPPKPQQEIYRALARTRKNDRLILNVALNYGGRREIVEGTRKLMQKAYNRELKPENLNEEVFAQHLYTAGLPDPDLLIRPAGELRISNFLLWQMAYTEFWITDVLWPDFRRVHFLQALVDYQQRERRFGGLKS
ncbi:isoprenyl transferase [Calderihabitans maritimus]|uniref:Isoprenyl transferase n=1 Tax=Calderihabitans maritimus TaxID=1246530 RepID=A0A1Z5HY74_9FIRM|nr:isoprenyl transferase [Calderihabitans maritimus]GAW94317.1 undecaprenyl diphosphate synthase [Calderihabitans maritimus]